MIFGTIAFFAARKSDGFASSIIGVVRATAQRKLLVPLVFFLAFIGIAILLAHKVGLWIPSLSTPTAIWILLSGSGLYFRMGDAIKDPKFFSDTLKQTPKLVVVVEFIANLESFPLGIEISTQLLAGLLGLMTIPVKNDQSAAIIGKVANGYFILLLTSAICWTVWKTEWEEVNYVALILEFSLPIWLTIVAIIYLYPLTLFAAHETTFVDLRRFSRVRRKRRLYRKMAAIILRSGLSLRAARTIGKSATLIVESDGFRVAWWAASKSIRRDQENTEKEQAFRRRLVSNTGLTGTYMNGKQLDQREHRETSEALRWLATCQMGHYRHPELQRYRNDKVFAAIIQITSEKHGLPAPHDIQLHVSADGQSWYAERETVTGHWFAIGAAGPPPDQWFYDGSTRPVGYPNENEWDQWGSGDHSMNWD